LKWHERGKLMGSGAFYENVVLLAKTLTLSQSKNIFGFSESYVYLTRSSITNSEFPHTHVRRKGRSKTDEGRVMGSAANKDIADYQ
jgi:hypothetical protein